MRRVSLVRGRTFPQFLSSVCAGIRPLLCGRWGVAPTSQAVWAGGGRGSLPRSSRLSSGPGRAHGPPAPRTRALRRALWVCLLCAVAFSPSPQLLGRLVWELLPVGPWSLSSLLLPSGFHVCECFYSAIVPVLFFLYV